MEVLRDHEVVVGTCEEHVLAYRTMKPDLLAATFTDHAHSGAVRCLAAAGKWMVSGAADENVKVFNLRKRTHHGDLRQLHQDTVGALVFYDAAHLVTAADDGKICILRTKDWQVEKTLTKHTGGVTSLSVHPSGKLALSVARDKKLITWNLVKGRSAYVTNLYEVADLVRWSPAGDRYLVGLYKKLDVYSTSSAKVEHSIPLSGRANEVAFVDDATAAVASDSPQVRFYDLATGKAVFEFDAHERRVRCLHVERDACRVGEWAMVTASNDGLIKAWRLKKTGEADFEAKCVAQRDTSCRITCMVVHRVPEVKEAGEGEQGKKKRRAAAEKAKKEELMAAIRSQQQSEEGGTPPKKKKKTVRIAEVTQEHERKKSPKAAVVTATEEGNAVDKKRRKKKRKS